MNSNDEVIFYQDQSIKITNTRAIFGEKTYAMGNITSVMTGTVPANRVAGIAMTILGIATAICGGSARAEGAIVGIVIIIIGFVLAGNAKTKYTVKIGSAGGETDALISKDKKYIQEIVNALNDAIIKRG